MGNTKVRPAVTIVIPNWNGKHLLEKHLDRVVQASRGAAIIVVDDGSSDGSVEYLRENFPDVQILVHGERKGFASAVNAGVAAASSDIVVLLNTDVEPEAGFLAPLTRHFTDPSVFAVGSMERSVEEAGEVLRGRGLAQWSKGFYIHRRGDVDASDTAWVSGGSGAFRTSMWEALGGMDILYNPFYWEDIDLSYRARKAEWKILFEPKSVVRHYHETGKIKREFTDEDVKRIAYRNQFIFIWKNLGDADILLSHAIWTPMRLLRALLTGDFPMILGYIQAFVRLPQIMAHRMKQQALWRVRDREIRT